MTKPLLAVDGDSLAHRAYHALPKQIRRAGGRPANMIVGFTNMLVGLWEIVEPRATFVGFDTLTTPTYRHVAFPAYQSGREFPPDLLERVIAANWPDEIASDAIQSPALIADVERARAALLDALNLGQLA